MRTIEVGDVVTLKTTEYWPMVVTFMYPGSSDVLIAVVAWLDGMGHPHQLSAPVSCFKLDTAR
jgi:hypothetical protein